MNIIEQFLQSRQEIIQKLLSGINHAVSIGKMFIKINEHHEKNYFIFIIKKIDRKLKNEPKSLEKLTVQGLSCHYGHYQVYIEGSFKLVKSTQ